MASTKIPLIYGARPSKMISKDKCVGTQNQNGFYSRAFDKSELFVRYPNATESFAISYGLDFSPDSSDRNQDYVNYSNNITDFYCQRDQGLVRNQRCSVHDEFCVKHMINQNLFSEDLIDLGDVNKVFCSLWLSPDKIAMGTKCNQLLVYDTTSRKVDSIPCLKGSTDQNTVEEQCGIHAVKANPSQTLLATGGQNSNEIAVYRLPTLDPVCMGEKAHTDWVFDVCWIDDYFLVSGSRDKSLALWRVDESQQNFVSPSYGIMEPLTKKKCFGADKVRSLLYNPNYGEVVALSLNAKIHVWDAVTFRQVMSQKLEMTNENVCLTSNDSCSIYAVGSKSHVTLIDPRTLQSTNKIDTRKGGTNIRSISFKESLLTIGTGAGDILFYDVKANRHMEGSHKTAELSCTKCHVSSDELHYFGLADSAIYTHSYDWSGTRLFVAGGPLSSVFKGCYASVWC